MVSQFLLWALDLVGFWNWKQMSQGAAGSKEEGSKEDKDWCQSSMPSAM